MGERTTVCVQESCLGCCCVLAGYNHSWLSFNEVSCAEKKERKKILGQHNTERTRGE